MASALGNEIVSGFLKLDEFDGDWDLVKLTLACLEGCDDSENDPDYGQCPQDQPTNDGYDQHHSGNQNSNPKVQRLFSVMGNKRPLVSQKKVADKRREEFKRNC